jgi:GxxExxY protein
MPVGENRQLEKRENQISGIILDAAIAIHSALLPIHEAQLLSYLKLSGKKLGLLINFHVLRLKDGYKRIVNGL